MMESLQQDRSLEFDWEQLELDQISERYDLALRDSLWIPGGPLGRIQIHGKDRLDLLERLSSNTFKHRAPGDHVRTALLEANGRLIDLLEVFIHDDHLVVSTSPGQAKAVVGWLQRHVFFQDDVNIQLLEAWPFVIHAFGPNSKKNLEPHISKLPAIESSQYHALQGILIQPIDWSNVTGYTLFIDHPEITNELQNCKHYDTTNPAQATAEALRVEAGIPRRGREITAGSIPLEIGLTEAISFTKGCYIGQEIIARLESRGRVANELSGVRLARAASPGAEITQSGKDVGTLTSCAYSPVHGWIGLALIKSRRIDRDSDDLSIGADPVALEELPFPGTYSPG